ncbi:MAG: hypothetical protein FWC70_10830 [Defluviitaleaceae bacterium]|nr:hypothetical protein [Defluviitaleaceae bacterium]
MTNYNKSEIMKKAWSDFREAKRYNLNRTFGHCLRLVWTQAKASIAEAQKRQAIAAEYAARQAERAEALARNPELAAKIEKLSYAINFGTRGTSHGKGSFATCEEIFRTHDLIAEKQRLESMLLEVA